ncbi:MAG: branched-chain amino acid ABC transporter permease [Deltaproteobacteria bacterium]|nr:branched-chain amino acid ABC transporter permease [Deltaproteobacteria bacterium]
MELFFQQLLNGIMLGSVYSLVALGLTLIYGILHVPNFAHGVLYMLGAYLAYLMVSALGFNFWVAMLLTMVILAVIGMLIERLVFRPLMEAPHLNSFIAAIGLIYIIENGALILWGPDFKRFPAVYDQLYHFLGITITLHRIIIVLTAISLIVIMQLFIKKTTLGATIVATAQDRIGARLAGINVERVGLITFGIGTALAAAAGVLIGPILLVYPSMGSALILKAFVIIILGGMGSIPGAIIGGFILGIIESLGGGYLTTQYNEVLAFGVLVTVLAIRPTGLFGKAH